MRACMPKDAVHLLAPMKTARHFACEHDQDFPLDFPVLTVCVADGGRPRPVNGGHRVNCANLRTFLRSFALEILEMSPMAFRLLIYVVGPRSAEMHSLMHFPSRESL